MNNTLIIFTLSLIVFTAPVHSGESGGEPDETLDADFLEFLADLESVDDAWAHPVDFDDDTIRPQYTTNKITASETNNE